MTSQIQINNPFVHVIVNKSDLPFIVKGLKNTTLNTMEKIILNESDFIGYLERTFQNTETSLVKIQINMIDEFPILVESIKSNQFLSGATKTEITQLNLETLITLIKELPKQYKQQIIAKKIALH